MNKLKFALPVVGIAAASSFAAEGDMTTYNDASAAITAIGNVASSAFNTFSGTIVPLLLGALVVVGGLTLGKWIIKKIRA